MKIIALDLGQKVGVACGEVANDAPALSTADLSSLIGPMMTEFEALVRGFIRREEPDVLAWERPFVQYGRAPDAQGELRTQRLYGQSAVCAKLAAEHQLRTCFERPVTVRKNVVGAGNAKEDAIMRFCVRAGVSPPNHHAADAYVMWRYARLAITGRR